MKKMHFCLLLTSCISEEISNISSIVEFQSISYITFTNENTGGGSQKVYHLSGFNESDVFCYWQEECSKELIVVSELEFNADTTDFWY